MRRLAAALALAAALTAPAAARAACPRVPGSQVERDNGRAVVWDDGSDLRACLRSTGRPFVLSDTLYGAGASQVEIAGRYVGFGLDAYERDTGDAALLSVEVWDMRRRRRVRHHEAHIAQGYQPRLRDLELRARTGSAAYVITAAGHEPSVWLFGGRPRRLDQGPGIDPPHLRREGNTVLWMHDGEQRRAALP